MIQLDMFGDMDDREFQATNKWERWERQQEIYRRIRRQQESFDRDVARARADMEHRSKLARQNPR